MSHNLALQPEDHRAGIERDKRRWFKAWQITQSRRPADIRVWLQEMEDGEDRNDWRRRLNALRHRSPYGR
ncbi:hypothetical protein [Marinobacter subterrani]|uniref:Uncharacterized protein n=1 Tax=Marinobacter subterrani TaxID=1658765 RepID=A0A0J7J794_9GAMM|nr:hypothetical protein [Marinobacter subterrani]KMQ74022.1 hypothetical protein Msub_10193 [Marinobacter subterrani]